MKKEMFSTVRKSANILLWMGNNMMFIIDNMRLVHLKTGHFAEKKLTSYMVLFLSSRTATGPL